MQADLADRFEVAGLVVFAVDGSRLRLPRTASNQGRFTAQRGRGPKAKRRRKAAAGTATRRRDAKRPRGRRCG